MAIGFGGIPLPGPGGSGGQGGIPLPDPLSVGTSKPLQPIGEDSTGIEPIKPTKELTHVNPVVQPIQPIQANAQLQSSQQPNLSDYIREAQKLASDQFNAQSAQIRQGSKGYADDLARSIYGQNVGASSGIGRDVQNRALAEQNARLESLGADIASRQGLEALNRKYTLDTNLMNMKHEDLKQAWQDAKAGNFDPNTANQIAKQMLGIDINTPEGQQAAIGFLNNAQVKNQMNALDLGIQYDPMSGKYYTQDARGATRELTGLEVQQMAEYGGYEGWRRATSKLASANDGLFATIEQAGLGNREDILNILFDPQYENQEQRKAAVNTYLMDKAYEIAQATYPRKESDKAARTKLRDNLKKQVPGIVANMTFDEYNISGGGGLV